MTNTTRILLWTDGAKPYLDAIAAAGLDGRVTVETVARKDQPSAAQCADTEAMLAWGAPAGLLPRMPRLRWAQALTAGVEGWLALPDLPPALTLTCARGTHRESMPENILGALFYLTKPYAAAVEDQKRSVWTRRTASPLNGQTLGILGLGEIGGEVARLASALGMRVVGTKRNPTPVPGVAMVVPPERTETVLAQADFVLALLPATPATANFIDAERLMQMKSNAWLLNFGRGHLIDDADLIAAVTTKRIAGAIWTCSGKSRCPRRIRSGPLQALSCCRISAAATRSAMPSWRGCSRTISRAFWMERRCGKRSIGRPGINLGRRSARQSTAPGGQSGA